MFEYKVTSNEWRMKPDPERAQQNVNEMAAEGWRLVVATNATGSGGGRELLYWEREKK